MRITLVDNFLLTDTEVVEPYPHLGLMSLAAVGEQSGHAVTIYDPKIALLRNHLTLDQSLYTKSASQILETEPDIIGFTTLGASFLYVVRCAQELKLIAPHIPITIGGPHASILDKEILAAFPEIDFVVRHEAEATFSQILDHALSLDFSSIPSVTWRKDGEIHREKNSRSYEDLDTLPIPSYDKYPINDLSMNNIQIDAGRGCPFECTFCSTATFFGRQYRLKSPQRLVREMDLLNTRYGFTTFILNHDLFTVDKKKVSAFCKAVAPKGYNWGVSARVDCVDKKLLSEMYDAGCRSIYFGIESGSPKIQATTLKKLKLEQFETILDWTLSLGMDAVCSFIVGYPQETPDDQDQTLNLIGSCLRYDTNQISIQLHLLTPEPGTLLLKRTAADRRLA